MNLFRFSAAYHDASDNLKLIQRRLSYADELERFILTPEHDAAEAAFEASKLVLTENVDKLFKACEYLKIPEIFIGHSELVTSLPRTPSHVPGDNQNVLVWRLKGLISPGTRYAAGCGNGNQTQTQNSNYYLEDQYLDRAWDVKTRSEVSLKEFRQYMVVSRQIKWIAHA